MAERERPSCCELARLLEAAWALLLIEQPPVTHFLRRGDVGHDRYEQAVAFRIGHHLANVVERLKPFGQVSVDMELKRKAASGQPVRPPDLILHGRGRDDENYLVVEFKSASNNDPEDEERERETIHRLVTGPRRYRHGVRATFDVAAGKLLLTDWLHSNRWTDCGTHPGQPWEEYLKRPAG
jgi:hypothetical protein